MWFFVNIKNTVKSEVKQCALKALKRNPYAWCLIDMTVPLKNIFLINVTWGNSRKNFEKQPFADVLQNRSSEKFFIHRKHLKICNFLKKTLPTQVFSCEYCEIFKTCFFYRTPLVAASELEGGPKLITDNYFCVHKNRRKPNVRLKLVFFDESIHFETST